MCVHKRIRAALRARLRASAHTKQFRTPTPSQRGVLPGVLICESGTGDLGVVIVVAMLVRVFCMYAFEVRIARRRCKLTQASTTPRATVRAKGFKSLRLSARVWLENFAFRLLPCDIHTISGFAKTIWDWLDCFRCSFTYRKAHQRRPALQRRVAAYASRTFTGGINIILLGVYPDAGRASEKERECARTGEDINNSTCGVCAQLRLR